METCDDEFADRAVDFIKRQHAAGKPIFVWVNFTTCTSAPAPSRRASGSPENSKARTMTR